MKNIAHAVNENDDAAYRLSLPPRINDMVRDYLDNAQDQIFDLVDGLGSPLNLIFPQIIAENIAAFQSVYQKHNIDGRIYVSTKPNKSYAAIRQAALENVGVDVSSEASLKKALECGFHPERIECTGPKNMAYLTLAILQGAIINADNMAELEQILALRQTLNTKNKTRIFVRLSGFISTRMKFTPHDSTFGINVEDVPKIVEFLKAHESELDFQGFAFHFNSKVIEQKIVALENILGATLKAMEAGLSPKGVNIGGGFDIQYAACKKQWQDYVHTIKESLRHYGPSLTWNNGGLGFRNEGGLIKGAPAYIDHAQDKTSTKEFDELLSLKLPSLENMSMAEFLSDCLLELYIEPGRSMFDQLGITIGRVNHTKQSAHGETLVNLDMNRSNINAAQQKLLTDPIILSHQKETRKPCENGVYYTGNLCLSYDMLTYQKSFPDFIPDEGDLVIFINTAAYIMDFVESETLHQPLAEKVAIARDNNRYRWFMDQKYRPAIHQEPSK